MGAKIGAKLTFSVSPGRVPGETDEEAFNRLRPTAIAAI